LSGAFEASGAHKYGKYVYGHNDEVLLRQARADDTDGVTGRVKPWRTQCLDAGCSMITRLSDGYCDPSCNIAACGYDNKGGPPEHAKGSTPLTKGDCGGPESDWNPTLPVSQTEAFDAQVFPFEGLSTSWK
jgi:hypothetical protein